MDMPAKMVVVKDRDKKILAPWRGEVNWSKKFMFRHFKFKGCSENRKYGAFLRKDRLCNLLRSSKIAFVCDDAICFGALIFFTPFRLGAKY